MKTERIIELASRPEGLGVTWRTSDARLMNYCRQLVAQGVLEKSGRLPGGGPTIFRLAGAGTGWRCRPPS